MQEALLSTMTGSALFLLLNGPNPSSNGKRKPTVFTYFRHIHAMLYTPLIIYANIIFVYRGYLLWTLGKPGH